MPIDEFNEKACRIITKRCLIATDIDRTVVSQGDNRERQQFLEKVAPQLLRAATLGTNLAFLTGNSMHELSSRFLRWIIDQLCHTDRLDLLDRLHFFCNSGGVYVHFSHQDKRLESLLSHPNRNDRLKDKVLGAITVPTDEAKKVAIRPCFIDAAYIERCRIPEDETAKIKSILEGAAQGYIDELEARRDTYEKIYDLVQVCNNETVEIPRPDLRSVQYGSNTSPKQAIVQITLKPILSFRHAHEPSQVFGKDLRTKVTEDIQARLDEQGLGYYVARPGGRSSIDVTLEKLDKAYALEFLIDRLNLQGSDRRGQKFGSNTIYFGDEVIVGGGNDYPVTRTPGLLVFAVNPDKDLVPFLSHVFVPSAILGGPDATAEVLTHFNKCALTLLTNFDELGKRKQSPTKTALDALKEDIFATRIREKITDLRHTDYHSVEDWQTLHAFVTLMCRNDPAARQWLSMLISELDAIMSQLATDRVSVQAALGTSHPDW